MDELIKLLNEYEKSGLNEFELEKYEEWWYCEWNGRIFRGNWENGNELTPYELCSIHYGFIKWLVENDKIDRNNVRETYGREFNYYWTIPNSKRDKEIQIERLLMLLSISSSPIDDLISYLK